MAAYLSTDRFWRCLDNGDLSRSLAATNSTWVLCTWQEGNWVNCVAWRKGFQEICSQRCIPSSWKQADSLKTCPSKPCRLRRNTVWVNVGLYLWVNICSKHGIPVCFIHLFDCHIESLIVLHLSMPTAFWCCGSIRQGKQKEMLFHDSFNTDSGQNSMGEKIRIYATKNLWPGKSWAQYDCGGLCLGAEG